MLKVIVIRIDDKVHRMCLVSEKDLHGVITEILDANQANNIVNGDIEITYHNLDTVSNTIEFVKAQQRFEEPARPL